MLKFNVVLLMIKVVLFPSMGQEKKNFEFDSRVLYRLTYQPDSSDLLTKQEEEMELLLNSKGQSLFRSLRRASSDSLMYRDLMSNNVINYPARPLFDTEKLNYQIVKEKDEITCYDAVSGVADEQSPIFYYRESMDVFDWEIRADTSTIAGMLCQKAEVDYGGRRWVAWFTTDIPVSDGPYKFAGLPGLILSIYDTQKYWYFLVTNINSVRKKVAINFDDKITYKLTTKEAFLKDRRNYQLNIVQIREAGGQLSRMSESMKSNMKKSYEQSLKKDNNWIEPFRP